ncbi:hypothetical protein [Xenorhabdus bovienii]|uniref:hypothetical protein n=1 Tax=Xenorhabdus bovienii TaxID=40576 RepID=UPI0023B216D6|nr:hypothetical protein [Xenorhabdus bovienii]MDE9428665.1 hypothetical protein [Xenorhabdus bovienii]
MFKLYQRFEYAIKKFLYTYGSFFVAKAISVSVYSSALALWMPGKLINLQFQYLILIEFFYGMLLFPLKISIMKNKKDIYSYLLWSFIFVILGLIYSFINFDVNINLLILAISLSLFPIRLILTIYGEITDIDNFILKENLSSTSSSIICAILFFMGHITNIQFFLNIIYRELLTTILIVIFNIKFIALAFQIKKTKFKWRDSDILSGVDYLLALFLFKNIIFKILSNGSYMSNEFSEKTIKYFSILYDPIAAVFGIALRRNLAIKGYTEYLKNTKYFFITLTVINIGIYLLAINMSEFYFLAIVFLFIFLAALLNSMLLIPTYIRYIIIFLLCSTTLTLYLNVLPFSLIFYLPMLIFIFIYKDNLYRKRSCI